MRLTRRVFLIFWGYHAWAGIVLGLVLYVMTLTGTITLFRHSLEIWGEPILQTSTPARLPLQTYLDVALTAIGHTPDELFIDVPAPSQSATTVAYEALESEPWQHLLVDPSLGTAVPPREILAPFLYHLHFLWHSSAPWLYYVAGLAAVALLFAIATGVLIHLRAMGRQLHRFRPHERPRIVWSDMHKVLGVIGLPFQTFYAYSGAMLVLGPPLIAAMTSSTLGVTPKEARRWVDPDSDEHAEHGRVTSRFLTLDALADIAEREVPAFAPRTISVVHHGRDDGSVEFLGDDTGPLSSARVRLREHDGAVLEIALGASDKTGVRFNRWIERLHFAHLGGATLRALYAVLGLATALTILSGNWIWIARRDPSGARTLARLTAGIGAGTPLAIAALFLASRLLPLDIPRRTSIEQLVFGCALGATVAWSLLARAVTPLWGRAFGLTGAMFAVAPFVATGHSAAGLFGAPGSRLADVVGVDLGLVCVGIALCAGSWILHSRTPGTADDDARHGEGRFESSPRGREAKIRDA